MAVRIDWLLPERVMLTDFSGQTTPQDIKAISTELPLMLTKGIPPVHWMVDIRNEVKPFRDLITLFQTLGFVRSSRLGWVVIVGQTTDPLIKVIIDAVTLFFSARCRRFDNPGDALAFLRGKDSTLPD